MLLNKSLIKARVLADVILTVTGFPELEKEFRDFAEPMLGDLWPTKIIEELKDETSVPENAKRSALGAVVSNMCNLGSHMQNHADMARLVDLVRSIKSLMYKKGLIDDGDTDVKQVVYERFASDVIQRKLNHARQQALHDATEQRDLSSIVAIATANEVFVEDFLNRHPVSEWAEKMMSSSYFESGTNEVAIVFSRLEKRYDFSPTEKEECYCGGPTDIGPEETVEEWPEMIIDDEIENVPNPTRE